MGRGDAFLTTILRGFSFLFFFLTTKTTTSFLYQAGWALEPGEPGCPKVALPYLEGAGSGKDTPPWRGVQHRVPFPQEWGAACSQNGSQGWLVCFGPLNYDKWLVDGCKISQQGCLLA